MQHPQRRWKLSEIRHPDLCNRRVRSVPVLSAGIFLDGRHPDAERFHRRRRRRGPVAVRRAIPRQLGARGGTLHGVVRQRVTVFEVDNNHRREREERDGEGGRPVRLRPRVRQGTRGSTSVP
ncbi:hypothetical protein AAZV13_12G144850 [Glycine max]